MEAIHTVTQGTCGTEDTLDIRDPLGTIVVSLFFRDAPDTDDAVKVKESAHIICQHLDRWQSKEGWVKF